MTKLQLMGVTATSLLVATGIITACSSDSSPTATAPPNVDSGTTPTTPTSEAAAPVEEPAPVSADVACTTLAMARCTKLDACSNGTGTTARYGDNPTCVTRLTAQCVASLAAASTGASPTSTQACAAALTAQSCTEYFSTLDSPEACAPVPGTLANGAACATSGQCQSAFCNVGASVNCGVCATPSVAGTACGPTTGCSRGFVCTGGAKGPGTCVVPAAAGQACGPDAPCDALLTCQVPTSDAGADAGDAAAPTTGTCIAELLDAGAPCGVANDDAICSRTGGLVCTGTAPNKACSVLGVVATAATCGDVDGGVVSCAAAGDCAIDAGEKVGSCEAAIADDSPCQLGIANPCIPPAKCVDTGNDAGTCAHLDPTQCQ